ncbi:MAG: hypothetical protein WCK89_24135 [bacterium]
MKTKIVLVLACLGFSALALAACGVQQAPATSAVSITALPEMAAISEITSTVTPMPDVLHQLAPNTNTLTISSTNPACQGLLGVDLGEASQRYPNRDEYLVLWTFTMNFKEFFEGDVNRPVGCVHFYLRNDKTQRYDRRTIEVPITCTIKGNGGITFETLPAANVTDFPTDIVEVGKATFDGGYIECPFQLRALADEAYTQTRSSEDVLRSWPITDNTYVYTYFAMAAVGQGFAKSDNVSYPIIHYEPSPACQRTRPACMPTGHLLEGQELPGYTTLVNGNKIGPTERVNAQPLQAWWVEIEPDPANQDFERVNYYRIEAGKTDWETKTVNSPPLDPVQF